jgi:hypothetical protein
MNVHKKPRPEAVLKNLPQAKQCAIIDFLDGTPTSKPHSFSKTVAWLKADGIPTNKASLCFFRSWFLRRKKMEANAAAALHIVEECKDKGWIKTRKEEEEAAQIFFNRMAMDEEDPKTWALAQGVSLRRDRLELEERKLKLLEDRHAQTKEVVNNTQMTPEQKEERIRQIMGLE